MSLIYNYKLGLKKKLDSKCFSAGIVITEYVPAIIGYESDSYKMK